MSVAENGLSAFQRAKISLHGTQGNTPQGPVSFFLKRVRAEGKGLNHTKVPKT